MTRFLWRYSPFGGWLEAVENRARLVLPRGGSWILPTPTQGGSALEVLRILVRHPGEVVTRQDLRDQLWSDGVYVDFDRSLNKAVVKLREALGDSAESPRFIETLPKVGYRFIAPVDGSRAKLESETPVSGAKAPPKVGWVSRFWIGLAAVVALIAILAYWLPSSPPPRVVTITSLSHSPEPKVPRLVSDGSRIYFPEHHDDVLRLMQLSVLGGEEVPLPSSLGSSVIYDISFDRSELLVGRIPEGVQYDWPPPLWIMPLVGGAPQRVGDVRAQSATWYPDGQSILYAKGGDLYRVRRDGSNATKLLSVSGAIRSPQWSPDGKRLRFDVASGGYGSSLWEAAPDGRNIHPLLRGWNIPANECCGHWTPDGKYYVYQSRQAGHTDLWAIREKWPPLRRADRSPVRLTNGPLNFMSPIPSSDGKKIYALGEQQLGELVRYDSVGRQFVPYLNGISAEGVSFSRDGQWVVYVSYPEGILWRSRIDGSDRLQLTQPPLLATTPVWSPSGKQIAFAGTGKAQPVWQMYVVSSDGGEPRQITFASRDQGLPWWSPDGTRIAYSEYPGWNPEVSVIDLSTLQVTTLPGSKGLCCPTWQRDGRIVALASHPPRIVRFDPVAQSWSELWQGPLDYYDLSHDEQYIYFDTKWQSDPAIFRLRISDRKLERVASLKGVRRTEGLSGMWFDLAPDDSPMLLRNLNTEQIYQLDLQLP